MSKTFIGGLCFMIGTIFIAVFAQNLPMLMGAEFIMGMPWGMFQTLATAYVAGEPAKHCHGCKKLGERPLICSKLEICPISLRGYAAAYASMGWGGGKLLATGVLRGCLQIEGNWAWRLPYALQWIWPVGLLLIGVFAPESEYLALPRNIEKKADMSARS